MKYALYQVSFPHRSAPSCYDDVSFSLSLDKSLFKCSAIVPDSLWREGYPPAVTDERGKGR
jgi:hypothetical protein